MTRNLKIIIIMCAGILLLIAVLAALTCDGCAEEQLPVLSASDTVSDSAVSTGDAGGVHMHENTTGELLAEGEDIRSLRLISEQGDYLIHRGENGELTIDSLSGLLLETDFIELVWYNSLAFGYSYALHSDEGFDLAAYGLEPAALTIECEYTDGTFCRLFVGDHISNSPNIYYFRFEGRDEIFLNEFDSAYFQGDYFWLSDDIFGDDVDDVTIGTIELSGSAFPEKLTIERCGGVDKSSPFYGYNYAVTAPYSGMADNYLMTMLTDELTELVADDTMQAKPTDQQLSEYGLNDPFVIIRHQRNGQWKTLRIARSGARDMYAMADGIDCVFLLSADTFPTIAALAPEYLRSAEVHVRYFDAVHTMRIQSGDIDLTFRLERTPMETDSTLYEYRAYCGDTQLSLNNYKAFLEVFNRAAAVSFDGQRQSDDPAVTVTITYFEGLEREEEVIGYYPAGTRRYLVQAEGAGNAVVGQMWIDDLLESAKALAGNETVTP